MENIKKEGVKDSGTALTVGDLVEQLTALQNQVGSSAMVLVQVPGEDARFTRSPTVQGGIVFVNASSDTA